MSLASALKRARKAVKAAEMKSSANNNKILIHKETDNFSNDPAGALVIVLKDLEVDSSQDLQEAV